MANPNSPRGIVPVRHFDGRMYNSAGSLYYIPASDSNNIFPGDPLIVSGSADANGVPGITLATAGSGNYITGTMQGIIPGGGPILPQIAVTRDQLVYRPAGVAMYINVCDDPTVLFEIQEDSVGGALAATAASSNANLVSGTGNTQYGTSGWQLQSSSVANTNTLQARIVAGLQRVDNVIGANFKWLIKINLHSTSNLSGV